MKNSVLILTAFLTGFCFRSMASNITVSNVSLNSQGFFSSTYTNVEFDLSWQNSWRVSQRSSNWDAAWVFVKFRMGVNDPVMKGASSSGTTVTVSSTANLRPGMPITVTSGTGAFASNTTITSIVNSTQFVVSATPTTQLSNATITCLRIWEHATLNTSAGNHFAPAGSTISVPTDGKGVFIYRDSDGSGTFSLTDVNLRWEYGTDALADDAIFQVRVFAIEMVYVPQSSFFVGSGGTESGSFTNGSWTSGNTIPFQITSEGALGINNASGKLWGTSSSGHNTIGNAAADPEATLAAAFPKGVAAFYCMKYELSQGQYRDFLNMLTRVQQGNRVAMDGTVGRYAGGITRISGAWSATELTNLTSPGNRVGLRLVADPGGNLPRTFACDLNPSSSLPSGVNQNDDGEWIAMGQLNWMDGSAYVDWAGLRPMTELEYEKACRGNQTAVSGEFAWGSTSITQATGISNGGLINETFSNSGANAVYNGAANVLGPLRVGAFASGSTTRSQSGASYWGIMELSGNLIERTVSIGNNTGRAFTGINGDGTLSAAGNANQANWPGMSNGEVTLPDGSGFRGGNWWDASADATVSTRVYAAGTDNTRNTRYGFRGVRVAP
jgi:formylglycine-generating enzyme required for sulfatase activity